MNVPKQQDPGKWRAIVKKNWERLVALCEWVENHPVLVPLLKVVIKILLRILED